MKYICAQPATPYFEWQVEVMINNFIEKGVNPNDIHILIGYDRAIPNKWVKLGKGYPSVNFFIYKDEREYRHYQPSIYFYLLKKHFEANPWLENETLFLHDSDILFTKNYSFSFATNPGDKKWYLSNTNSYLNYDYIQQKGDYIYRDMCSIVGIDPLVPRLMKSHSGGAQYIVKNTNYDFWDVVEKTSVELYDYFVQAEPQFKKDNPNVEPIQKWTAGMWSILWNAWLAGHETVVDSRMDFCFATSDISEVDRVNIFHNAGVMQSHTDLFRKTAYTQLYPYNIAPEPRRDSASWYYWNEVQKVAKKTFLAS